MNAAVVTLWIKLRCIEESKVRGTVKADLRLEDTTQRSPSAKGH